MTSRRVLVTPRSMTSKPSAALDRLRENGFEVVLGPVGRQPTKHELAELLPEIDAWIAGVELIDRDLLRRGAKLRVISRNGAGQDSIDLASARARGIAVLTTPGANAAGVAELSIALMLSLLRSIPGSNTALVSGRWSRTLGHELSARTVGVIGMGAIGRRVAGLAAAFGATVIAHDPFIDAASVDSVPVVELNQLIERADVITLHAPGPASGAPLLGRAQLSLVTPGTLLINTARWEVVDDAAVLDALRDSRLGGYAIDAYTTEPPAPHPLFDDPRVIATPHLGAYTAESVQRASDAAIDNVIGFFGGQP